MAKSVQIKLVVHFPKSNEGMQELETRIAQIHAKTASAYIQKLNCPLEQKLKLHDAVTKASQDKNSQKE